MCWLPIAFSLSRGGSVSPSGTARNAFVQRAFGVQLGLPRVSCSSNCERRAWEKQAALWRVKEQRLFCRDAYLFGEMFRCWDCYLWRMPVPGLCSSVLTFRACGGCAFKAVQKDKGCVGDRALERFTWSSREMGRGKLASSWCWVVVQGLGWVGLEGTCHFCLWLKEP